MNHGEFALKGLRNAEVRAILYPRRPDGLTDRQLASRVAHPLVRWRVIPTKTDRLVIAPQDLRTTDAVAARSLSLPMANGLRPGEAARIAAVVATGLRRC